MFNLMAVPFREFISQPLVIVGLLFLAFGISFAVLARRIARVERQTNDIPDDDRVYVGFKIVGIVLLVIGFALIAGYIISYIVTR